MRRYFFVLIGLLLLAAGLAKTQDRPKHSHVIDDSSQYKLGDKIMDNIERSFQVTSGGRLTIDSDWGSIDVQTAERDGVDALIKRGIKAADDKRAEEILKDLEITFEQDGSDVKIEAKFKRGRKYWKNDLNRLKVLFSITVPEKYHVDLRTAGGSISVADLEGEVRSQTSGGNLRFGKINGPVWGRTSGGNIELKSCSGDADVNTSGGNIEVGNVGGQVKAKTSGGNLRFGEVKGSVWGRTSGGNIKLKSCDGDVDVKTSGGNIDIGDVNGDVKAITSGGSIKAHLLRQPKKDCFLKTSGGSVTVSLPSDVAVNINAKTSSGRVSSDFPVTGTLKKNQLQGTINGGGPLLQLLTSAGSIRLRKEESE